MQMTKVQRFMTRPRNVKICTLEISWAYSRRSGGQVQLPKGAATVKAEGAMNASRRRGEGTGAY